MNQDKIWNVYQNDPELQAMGCRDGGRIHYIARRVPVSATILNIGVGQGNLERLLVEKRADVYCLDPSEQSINNLRKSLGLGEKARAGYSQEIPFEDESCDCVVMTEVLEHLCDQVLEKTRAEVLRVLKPGGVFIGSVPADENLIDSMVVCPDCGKRFHRWGHVQSFSKKRIRDFLNSAFSDVEVRRVCFSDWGALNWKGKLSAMARELQARLDRKGSNQNFFFRARKLKA